MKTHNWLDTFLQDLHFAFRQLIQSPGFTVSAVSLLALGIGLNAAIFTLMDSVILRALPLPEVDRLVILVETEPSGCCSPPPWLDQRDIRERTHAFQSIAAYSFEHNFVLRLGDQTQRIQGGYVTPDYFSTLGVAPIQGRVFQPSEATAGGDNVVLVREDFWRSVLHGDPNILEKTVIVNGKTCNVIGIMPASFHFPVQTAVIWIPLVPPPEVIRDRGWHGFPLVARLKRAVTSNRRAPISTL